MIFRSGSNLLPFTETTSRKTVTLSGDGEAKRNCRSRMGITLVRLSTDELFAYTRLNRGQILRLTSFAQDDKMCGLTLAKSDSSCKG